MSKLAAIRVVELNYAYANGQIALSKLCFSIDPGETVGLIGPNGAGKTTLFLCLAGILKSSVGAIAVDGLDPAIPAQRKQLPSRLGVVFQNSDDQLIHATVADDVAFGPLNLRLREDDVRERVAEALDRVGLTGFDERVPFHLSGGENAAPRWRACSPCGRIFSCSTSRRCFLTRAAAASWRRFSARFPAPG